MIEYESKYLLYILDTGENFKLGIIESRNRLNKRFNDLFKQLAKPTEEARAKIKFARVYEGITDVHVKTTEKTALKELFEHRLPQANPKGKPTEYFDSHITLDMIVEAIEKQPLFAGGKPVKLNLLYTDYIPEYEK